MEVKWFEMDETELICVGMIRKVHKHIAVIDFLPTPPSMELRSTASNKSLSSGDATAWRFPLPPKKSMKHELHWHLSLSTLHTTYKKINSTIQWRVMIAHDPIETWNCEQNEIIEQQQ